MAKMTKKEKMQWDELYEYVRSEVLKYDKNQSLPSNIVLRLKGLTKGKYIENKGIKDRANYSYDIILYSFQLNRLTIDNILATKEFHDEAHKFNYICKIVERDLNDIYLRKKRQESVAEAIDSLDLSHLTNNGVKYKGNETKETNSRLDDLW